MEKILFTTECRGTILEVIDTETERRLQSDGIITHSRFLLKEPNILIQPYQQQMMAALALIESPQRILHLGLGGGCQISFIHRLFPYIEQDVIECSETIVSIALTYFSLPESTTIHIHVADAIKLKTLVHNKYDLIFLDLCDSFGPIPCFQETTYLLMLKELLKPKGWVAANSWSSGEGLSNTLTRWKSIFPEVRVVTEGSREAVIYGGLSPPGPSSFVINKLPEEVRSKVANLYRSELKNWNFGFEKAPGLTDRK